MVLLKTRSSSCSFCAFVFISTLGEVAGNVADLLLRPIITYVRVRGIRNYLNNYVFGRGRYTDLQKGTLWNFASLGASGAIMVRKAINNPINKKRKKQTK